MTIEQFTADRIFLENLKMIFKFRERERERHRNEEEKEKNSGVVDRFN